jgi:lipopolysaccharide transport system permease protein
LRTPSHGGADGGGASEVACEVAGAGESTFQGTGKGDAWRRSSEGWLVLLSPVHTWARLWRTRELLWGLSTRAIAERHKGSALGLVWLVVQPLLMLSVYTFVFSVVWRATWTTASAGAEHASAATASGASAGMLGFASMVFAGLVVYEVFSTSVAASPSAIVQNPNYVKKVVFPVELLPLSNVVSACLLSLVGVGVLVVGRVLMGEGVSRTLWLLPVVVLPVALLAAGISLIIAALATYFRDIRPIVQGVMLQVLFFMTPIFYPMERVPAWLRESLQLNPLAGLVQQARGVLVLGAWPDWQQLLVLGGAGLVVFQVGYAFFMRAKRGFADVL